MLRFLFASLRLTELLRRRCACPLQWHFALGRYCWLNPFHSPDILCPPSRRSPVCMEVVRLLLLLSLLVAILVVLLRFDDVWAFLSWVIWLEEMLCFCIYNLLLLLKVCSPFHCMCVIYGSRYIYLFVHLVMVADLLTVSLFRIYPRVVLFSQSRVTSV